MHFVTDKYGKQHKIEEYGWDKEKITLCIDNCKVITLKMHYRHERTWDDHLGNTPCGYYAVVPIPVHYGEKKERRRVYLDLYR